MKTAGTGVQAYGRTGAQVPRRVYASERLCLRASVPLCLCASVLWACVRGTNHERLGDRRYAEGAWVDALAEYRLAARQRKPSLELRAKLGAAALRSGALGEAVAAYAELAVADPASATGEAAEGLLRTARAALAARDVEALRGAVGALRTVSPQHLVLLGGTLAGALDPEREGAQTTDLFLAAAGQAGASADSLIALWAGSAARSGRCDAAGPAFEALARRAASTALARTARGGLAGCRVESGRAALAAGRLEEAEAAFRAAVQLGTPDSTVRLAWVLIGDTRWAGGDTALALEAYYKAIAGAEEDNPIALRAQEQIRRLTGGNQPPQ